jgi:hypothetical protein
VTRWTVGAEGALQDGFQLRLLLGAIGAPTRCSVSSSMARFTQRTRSLAAQGDLKGRVACKATRPHLSPRAHGEPCRSVPGTSHPVQHSPVWVPNRPAETALAFPK